MDASEEVDGVIAYTGVFPVALSADQRTAIFAGADPALVAGGAGTTGAVWKLDNAVTDSSGNGLDLTAVNSPTAQNNLLVVRDLSGGGYHLRATTSAPTWSSTIGNGQGGAVMTGGTSMLSRDGTPPASIAPIQVYSVAQADNTTGVHLVFQVTDKDVSDDQWYQSFRGDQVGDPTRWTITDTSADHASTTTGYSADTNYLLWGASLAGNSHYAERNGGSQGTNGNTNTPDNADRVAIGTTTNSLVREIHFVLLLNHAGINDLPRIETFTSGSFSLGF